MRCLAGLCITEEDFEVASVALSVPPGPFSPFENRLISFLTVRVQLNGFGDHGNDAAQAASAAVQSERLSQPSHR